MKLSINKAFFFIFLFFSITYPSIAQAQLLPDLATMLDNFTKTIPELISLVAAFSYVLGLFLVMKGLTEFKHVGESRSMMSREHHFMSPFYYIFTGAAFLYLPTAIQVGTSTFWGSTVPYSYIENVEDAWSHLIKDCFMVLQLIGLIAFIRGMMLLSQMSEQYSQHGTFGRAMAHIIGGIICINMYSFMQVIFSTLALGQI